MRRKKQIDEKSWIFLLSNPKWNSNKSYVSHFSGSFVGRLKYLTLTEANRVWMPDLFFSNEKEGHFHNIIMPNVYIRIFPYGSVLYSIRISLTLACPMNLKLYPLDRQVCSLRMASCKYIRYSYKSDSFAQRSLAIRRRLDHGWFGVSVEGRWSSASG